jgi:hypothetical protein
MRRRIKPRPLLVGIAIIYGLIVALAVFGVGSYARYDSPFVYLVLMLCVLGLVLHVAASVALRSWVNGIAAAGSALLLLYLTLAALTKVTGDSL